MSAQQVTFDDFQKLDIRAGTILTAAPLEGAKKLAYRLTVDLGPEIGVKQSSAQVCTLYEAEALVGRQVLAVTNFPPRKVAGFVSEVLVLGLYAQAGVVLITPERTVQNGDRLG